MLIILFVYPVIGATIRLWMRRIHVALNVLVALLLATQAITGTRDLWLR